jgi:hypothetical protein
MSAHYTFKDQNKSFFKKISELYFLSNIKGKNIMKGGGKKAKKVKSYIPPTSNETSFYPSSVGIKRN